MKCVNIGSDYQMNKPIVSIIMPVYNTEKFIEEAIKSVINQKYRNIELICVNDKTPDRAIEICKNYQKKYSNIKIIENEENMGLEFTRNRGMEEMTGKYVMFLDSDDTIDDNMVEKMVNIAEKNESQVVLSAYSMIIDGNDKPVLANISDMECLNISDFSKLLLDKLEWRILCCVGSKLYRADVIKKNHLRFDRKYKYNEDGGFILSFLLLCNKVSYIDEPFYKYQIRKSGSIMSSYRPEVFSSIIKVNELLRRIFINNGIYNTKQELYYRKLFFLILDSLRNEAKYGDFDSYNETLKTIRNYEDYEKMQKSLIKSNILGIKQKGVLICMRLNLYNILYRIIK
ncbi:glycosyltransferase family 2 protein [Clostridium paraputrificum]|uniref:glycosyltransferase family 2 protein n=1 Tax=Clostridium paraputrificum TaxID=29363 RepID=UPI00041D9036|nr:glycosyltransferase [Clostridium paraputrificum]